MLNKGNFMSGGAIWIRMCECNLKNPNFGAFFKERVKIKRIWADILNNVIVEFEFA